MTTEARNRRPKRGQPHEQRGGVRAVMLRAYNRFSGIVRNDTVGELAKKGFQKSNHFVYWASRGRLWNTLSGGLWNTLSGGQIILVAVRGRKTGKTRKFPLLSVNVDGSWVIIGSNAGGPTHPAWVHNLRADPTVVVTVKASERAREVSDETEYERYYGHLVSAYANYESYKLHAGRTMPIFVLEPGDAVEA